MSALMSLCLWMAHAHLIHLGGNTTVCCDCCHSPRGSVYHRIVVLIVRVLGSYTSRSGRYHGPVRTDLLPVLRIRVLLAITMAIRLRLLALHEGLLVLVLHVVVVLGVAALSLALVLLLLLVPIAVLLVLPLSLRRHAGTLLVLILVPVVGVVSPLSEPNLRLCLRLKPSNVTPTESWSTAL